MSSRKIEAARKRFEAFTGMTATTVEEIEVPPLDDVLFVVGECEAIAYNTVRDGIVQSFQHEFRKKSRPVLAVSSDGRRLYLLAGAYKFTDRGIEDR
ncbi:MAG: hypothetical protein RML32_07760 [Gammaproteobacteria bacterium]|nr:hypothetical protein [Gammaproteobacteria bacterium]